METSSLDDFIEDMTARFRDDNSVNVVEAFNKFRVCTTAFLLVEYLPQLYVKIIMDSVIEQ